MKCMLKKDLLLLLQRKGSMALFAVLSLILGINSGVSSMAAFIAVFFTMMAAGTISYDEFDNGYPFLMTLPVTRKEYVREKYLFCGIVSLAAWASAMALGFVIMAVKGSAFSPMEELTAALLVFLLFFLYVDLIIPVRLKYGTIRTRSILLIIFLAAMILIGLPLSLVDSDNPGGPFANGPGSITMGMVLAAVFLFTLAATAVSLKISQRVMEKKEF